MTSLQMGFHAFDVRSAGILQINISRPTKSIRPAVFCQPSGKNSAKDKLELCHAQRQTQIFPLDVILPRYLLVIFL